MASKPPVSKTSRALRQYLDRHAEPEISMATGVTRRFGHVLTIPAAGEGASLHQVLSSIPAGPLGDVLLILVVNASVESPRWIKEANLDLFEQLKRDWGSGLRCGVAGTLYARPHGSVLLVDRASPGRELPAKQGVGLARKIGADLALALWDTRAIDSPWIHCTDADVALPSDYFAQPMTAALGVSALTYRYRHVPEDGAMGYTNSSEPRAAGWRNPAALEYEISLRYYVRGLAYAGSPYAFHTIGSTLAIHASAYALTRGFPKRLAAEDFYLLNKLAKVGRVEVPTGLPIELSSRLSARVPFGTGRALSDAPRGETRSLYHPGVFDYLARWQSLLLAASASPETSIQNLLRQSTAPPGVHSDVLERALDSIGALDRAPVRARTQAVRLSQLQQAFDAGRTLKLIHALRELALPSIPLHQAIEIAPFVDLSGRIAISHPDFNARIATLESIAAALGRPSRQD
jgi:hypothetical protein